MKDACKARDVIMMIFCFLVVLGLGWMWGYEKGYEGCMEDAGIKKIIEYNEVD